jgi:hypothetical protein
VSAAHHERTNERTKLQAVAQDEILESNEAVTA